MAFESFGRLPDGSFFRWRGKIWVKVPMAKADEIRFNAYSSGDDDDGKATAVVVDEAVLVDTDTGVSEERKNHHLALFAKGDKT